jgi:putative transposase
VAGPRGLLTGLTKQVLETALDFELADHLGHDRGKRSGSVNVRNGSSSSGKTARTNIDDVQITASRDRAATFTPRVAAKATVAAGRPR